jgi:hypothetical protein
MHKLITVVMLSASYCLPASAYIPSISNVQDTPSSHTIADSFQGIAASGYDWPHIFKNHSPSGEVAKQRLKASADYSYSIYQNMTDNQIKSCVQRAWKDRKKVETQPAVPPATARRIKYRAYDAETKYTLEIWQNEDTGFIETAYPIRVKP